MMREKYNTILEALAETIENRNNTILFQKYQIEDLQKRLEDAEHLLNSRHSEDRRAEE